MGQGAPQLKSGRIRLIVISTSLKGGFSEFADRVLYMLVPPHVSGGQYLLAGQVLFYAGVSLTHQ